MAHRCSRFCALAAQPASELQATVAMVARRASCNGGLSRSHLPGPCISLPDLPSASSLAHHHKERMSLVCTSRTVCVQARLPRSRSTLIYLLCPEAASHEHTLKLTM